MKDKLLNAFLKLNKICDYDKTGQNIFVSKEVLDNVILFINYFDNCGLSFDFDIYTNQHGTISIEINQNLTNIHSIEVYIEIGHKTMTYFICTSLGVECQNKKRIRKEEVEKIINYLKEW